MMLCIYSYLYLYNVCVCVCIYVCVFVWVVEEWAKCNLFGVLAKRENLISGVDIQNGVFCREDDTPEYIMVTNKEILVKISLKGCGHKLYWKEIKS